MKTKDLEDYFCNHVDVSYFVNTLMNYDFERPYVDDRTIEGLAPMYQHLLGCKGCSIKNETICHLAKSASANVFSYSA